MSNCYTWDIFSLSLIFIKLTYFLKNKNKINNKFFDFFIELLKLNIHPNPEERPSCEETMKKIKEYVLTNEMKTDTINAGFTKKHIKTVKRYEEGNMKSLENKLLTETIKEYIFY